MYKEMVLQGSGFGLKRSHKVTCKYYGSGTDIIDDSNKPIGGIEVSTIYIYNDKGHLTEVTSDDVDMYDYVYEHEYDENDRKVYTKETRSNKDSGETEVAHCWSRYDKEGNVVSCISKTPSSRFLYGLYNNHVEYYNLYDEDGRVLSTVCNYIDEDGISTLKWTDSIEYNKDGNKVRHIMNHNKDLYVTNRQRVAETYYDDRSNVIKEVGSWYDDTRDDKPRSYEPGRFTDTFTYDENDNMLSSGIGGLFCRNRLEYTYDENNNPISVSNNHGDVIEYGYDVDENMIYKKYSQVENNDGTASSKVYKEEFVELLD